MTQKINIRIKKNKFNQLFIFIFQGKEEEEIK